jgi:hypothetical protein
MIEITLTCAARLEIFRTVPRFHKNQIPPEVHFSELEADLPAVLREPASEA